MFTCSMIGKCKSMLASEDAVSPVIGVILMVAVTVVLAAVIAGFVFGLGGNLSESPPNAQFEYTVAQAQDPATGNDVTLVQIWHDGGESVDGQLDVTFSQAPEGEMNGSAYGFEDTAPSEMRITGFDPGGVDPNASPGSVTGLQISVDEPRQAGDNLLTMAYDGSQDVSGTELRVTWVSDDGSTSATLDEHTVE
ncbi:hypothetical protein DJ70_07040 [Halorubrum halodurans]|uniref:Archaeal Type IV pilin N-terminal domain-containing protein n=2 Tax=Halorubrum halodurans TaxID=1383851 RepID=A0A256ILD5_9EURY|nr:hypothetical protein DJ70_07040 [Halorubrum halodurans]